MLALILSIGCVCNVAAATPKGQYGCNPITNGYFAGFNSNTDCANNWQIHGATCPLTCVTSGFAGAGTATCVNNPATYGVASAPAWYQWATSGTTCTAVHCATLSAFSLPSPAGTTIGNCDASHVVGDTCSITCPLGYSTQGTTTCVGLAAGYAAWNVGQTCIPAHCRALTPPANSASTNCTAQIIVSQTCTITCNSGYVITGSRYTCAGTGGGTAALSGSQSCVPMPCTSPTSSSTYNIQCSGQVANGGTCLVSCAQSGYTGSMTMNCVAGRWMLNSNPTNPSVLQCATIPCTAITAGNTGLWNAYTINCSNPGTGGSIPVGGRCTLSCSTDRVVGSITRTCLVGPTWTTTPLVCTQLPCPTIQNNPDTDMISQCTSIITPWQGTCALNCTDTPYSHQGEMLQCTNGYWPVSSLQCNPTQCPEYVTDNQNSCDSGMVASGSSCTITCYSMYTGTPATVLCTDGQWNTYQDISCQKMTCNASDLFTGTSDYFAADTCMSVPWGNSSTCELVCADGYQVVGTAPICRVLWADVPPFWVPMGPYSQTCQPVACQTAPSMSMLANGISTSACIGTSLWAACSMFTCQTGFVPVGFFDCVGVAEGESGFTYDAQLPAACAPIVCPSLSNAYGQACSTSFGSVCEVVCNAGYTLTGTAPTCILNTTSRHGMWYPPGLESCQPIVCDPIGPIANGLAGTCVNVPLGSMCEIGCNAGYTPVNGLSADTGYITSSNTTCVLPVNFTGDTVYDYAQFCAPAYCPTLTTLNGQTCALAQFGYVCSPQCIAGYSPTSDIVPVCGADLVNGGLAWSADSSPCVENPCLAAANQVANGTLSNCTVGTVYQPGVVCVLSCPTCTSGATTSTLCCLGVWSAFDIPACPSVCCPTIASSDADTLYSSDCAVLATPDGEDCTLTCDAPGYEGAVVYNCEGGEWNGTSPPSCQPLVCTGLSAPSNGFLGTCTTSAPWTAPSCAFTCADDYVLVGDAITCTFDVNTSSVSWTEVQQCVPATCLGLAAPAHGSLGSCTAESAWTSDPCNFVCDEDYMLSGAAVQCAYNSSGPPAWSTPQTCVPMVCTGLSAPVNGSLGTCSPSATWGFANCSFACDEDYVVTGYAITCDFNSTGPPQWSALQTCAPMTCNGLTAPANGSMGSCPESEAWSVSSPCTFVCDEDFMLNGAAITCDFDSTGPPQWSTPQTCVPMTCTGLAAPAHGSLGACTASAPWGSPACSFMCDRDYMTAGPAITCSFNNSGPPEWSAPQTCVPMTCDGLTPPLNGSMGTCLESTVWGAPACNFTCDEDFLLVGEPIMCMFDDCGPPEQSPAQVCVPMSCSGLVAPGNGSLGTCVSPVVFGSPACNFSCNQDYVLSGPAITCTFDSSGPPEWSALQTCVEMVCPALVAPVNGGLGTCVSGTVWGAASCDFVCNAGYALSGSSMACLYEADSPPAWSAGQVCSELPCTGLSYAEMDNFTSNCTEGTVYPPGSVCEIVCPSCSTGPSVLFACSLGAWSFSEGPSCSNSCCPPIASGGADASAYTSNCSGGVVAGSGACTLACDSIDQSGSVTYTCQSGSWNADVTGPVCNVTTCNASCNAVDDQPCSASCGNCEITTIGSGFTASSVTVTSPSCFAATFCANLTTPAIDSLCNVYCVNAFSGALCWDGLDAVCDSTNSTITCGCSMG